MSPCAITRLSNGASADVDQKLSEGLDEQPLGPGRRQHAEQGDRQQGEQAQILNSGRLKETQHEVTPEVQ
jgi:hypothetical protein